MGRETDIAIMAAERIVMATNSYTSIPAFAGQVAVTIKLLAGGTLEIGGSGNTYGTGYPLASTEVQSIDNSGNFYLFASGATCTVAILRGKTTGT